jgi:formylglycine-generating enzyme required for sulfatase activity
LRNKLLLGKPLAQKTRLQRKSLPHLRPPSRNPASDKKEWEASRKELERNLSEKEQQRMALAAALEGLRQERDQLKALLDNSLPGTATTQTPGRCSGIEAIVGNDKACLKPNEVFKDCTDCPAMVVVPRGTFTMGSPENEEGRSDDEGPQHQVTISKPFAVGRFAVTRGEFASFIESLGSDSEGGCKIRTGADWTQEQKWSWRRPGFLQNDQHPVVCVSWDDAKAFVGWLSKKTSKPYRLLTEAEREYVARAGTTTPFWWGSAISTEQANYDGTKTYGSGSKGTWRKRTVPVDMFTANPWGLYNVHGNIWEWVDDCWHDSYKGAPTNGTAWTTGDCERRMRRGGSWGGDPADSRAARRHTFASNQRFNYLGFRLARTLAP